MIGQTLGHYRIVEKIGTGGMGIVYRARDERLQRDVALKVLPAGTLADESARRQFRKEALALSQLNHPNIATVHDFDTQEGVDFLVLEYIPGATLDEKLKTGPLGEKELVRLGGQMMQGLAAAHEAGVVHRDLKPGNLQVTPDGRLKILDFGLATLRQPEGAEALTRSVTEGHGVAGTLPYMSPEQLRGERVDPRSDVFSAGAVLYEMSTGRRPFAQVADTLLNPPAPPGSVQRSVAPGLEQIILKALDKDPERRYQSAREIVVDLERLSGPSVAAVAAPVRGRRRWPWAAAVAVVAVAVVAAYWLAGRGGAIDSVAVLPFENAGGDPNGEYLSDGITESLIGNLTQLPELRVIARASVFRYKGRAADPQAVARELNVRAVVMGRVAQRGENLSVSAELIDTRDNRRVWGEQYQRRLADVLALEGEISRDLSRRLRVRPAGEAERRPAKRPTANTEAYQLYLKGRYYWNKMPQDVDRGIQSFQQAIEKDPNYALAYTGLADYYLSLGSWEVGAMAPAEAGPKARAAARKALEIDDQLAEAHTSMGYALLNFDWDWAGAERELRRSLELDPRDSNAQHRYSHYCMAVGRVDESLAASQRALELDPLNLIISGHLGWHYVWARQPDQAIEQVRKTLELDPNFFYGHLLLGWADEQKGMYQEAIAAEEKASEVSGRNALSLASLGHAYAVGGKRAQALQVIEELKERSRQSYVGAYEIAVIYVGLGDKDQAFAWLEKACQERSAWLVYLTREPRLDPLRPDPRFRELVRRVGVPS